MTCIEERPPLDSTSAAGAMLRGQVREPVLLGWMLVGLGTSTAYVSSEMALLSQPPIEQTTAGAIIPSARPTGAAIAELRRLSGLTWDQLARMFAVSRRSLHFWASGKPMASNNEEHLQRILAVLRRIDRGSSSANRALLLAGHEDDDNPFDLLASAEYERALALMGSGDGRRVSPKKPSQDVRAARAPRPPEELVGALQDRIHPAGGRLLAAKRIVTNRRK